MITKQDFKANILPHVLINEGGYVNRADKKDKGGETYRGISRVNNPEWSGWDILAKMKPANGDVFNNFDLKEAVADLYFSKYFAPYRFDALNSEVVALNLFDWAVNGGYCVARLQKILQTYEPTIKADGILGFKTMSAINAAPVAKLCNDILAIRKVHFTAIVDRDPTQEIFFDGWCNRLLKLKKLLKGV